MPIVAPQSLRGGGERRGRKAGLRRTRRVSPLVAATGGGDPKCSDNDARVCTHIGGLPREVATKDP